MELKANLEDIENLIEERAETKSQLSVNIQTIKREYIIKQLKKAEEEIMNKHIEAKKLWKESVKIYSEFIRKNPGSKQLNPPQAMPEEPTQTDTVKGYIKIFESMVDDEINIDITFLKSIFTKTAEGLYEARHQAYLMMTAASGLSAGLPVVE